MVEYDNYHVSCLKKMQNNPKIINKDIFCVVQEMKNDHKMTIRNDDQ